MKYMALIKRINSVEVSSQPVVYGCDKRPRIVIRIRYVYVCVAQTTAMCFRGATRMAEITVGVLRNFAKNLPMSPDLGTLALRVPD